ncbi:MAG: hypothetical protein CBC82_05725 [Cellvibrionales bacterium TMED122]|nr:hypothetical protein [Halieaceae bacterium]OUV61866.1 MAG: hypothetical protein CBC82_05725 [Cellvibrionales bacterium TMED122]
MAETVSLWLNSSRLARYADHMVESEHRSISMKHRSQHRGHRTAARAVALITRAITVRSDDSMLTSLYLCLRPARPAQRLIWALTVLTSACTAQNQPMEAELFPENQLPHFKTCAARLDGTFHERALRRHQIVDIYEEPAPDEGLMTEDCVVRE